MGIAVDMRPGNFFLSGGGRFDCLRVWLGFENGPLKGFTQVFRQ